MGRDNPLAGMDAEKVQRGSLRLLRDLFPGQIINIPEDTADDQPADVPGGGRRTAAGRTGSSDTGSQDRRAPAVLDEPATDE